MAGDEQLEREMKSMGCTRFVEDVEELSVLCFGASLTSGHHLDDRHIRRPTHVPTVPFTEALLCEGKWSRFVRFNIVSFGRSQ